MKCNFVGAFTPMAKYFKILHRYIYIFNYLKLIQYLFFIINGILLKLFLNVNLFLK